jgi:hypothetical protein
MNPQKASSGSQFYIVWGQVYKTADISQLEEQKINQLKNAYFQQLAGKQQAKIQQLYQANDQANAKASVRTDSPDGSPFSGKSTPRTQPRNNQSIYQPGLVLPPGQRIYRHWRSGRRSLMCRKIQHRNTDTADRPKPMW